MLWTSEYLRNNNNNKTWPEHFIYSKCLFQGKPTDLIYKSKNKNT